MKYYLIQDDMNPSIQMYYVIEEGTNSLLKVIDMDCNECGPPIAHSIIDSNPPLPPCAQP
jgi:hypothetical protein